VLNEARAGQILEEAIRLANAGQAGEATSRLQSLIYDSVKAVALRDYRARAFKGLLQILFQQGRDARLSKIFRQYAAEFGDGSDPEFDGLYVAGALATRTLPLPLRRRNRFLILTRRLAGTLPLQGLIAECGCFQGLSSFLICSCMKRFDPAFDGSGYEIYDSFQGLSAPQAEDFGSPDSAESFRIQPNVVAGAYAAPLEQVKRALSAFPRIAYFPGWIPAAFRADDLAGRYRFVHVDVDLYVPTLASLEYFWPKMVPGGIMACDDYNWPGARQAVDEFCARQGLACEVTPTLQAFITCPARS
jgi:hypothetical protein